MKVMARWFTGHHQVAQPFTFHRRRRIKEDYVIEVHVADFTDKQLLTDSSDVKENWGVNQVLWLLLYLSLELILVFHVCFQQSPLKWNCTLFSTFPAVALFTLYRLTWTEKR